MSTSPKGSALIEVLLPARLGSPFRRLMLASWTTNVGDGIAIAAGPLLVASQTHDPMLVALAPMLQQLPWLLFGLYAGAQADRVDRRRLVVAANLSRTLVLAVLVTFIAADQVTIPLVLVVVFLFGTAEVFSDTTSSTLTPMLVDKADLGIANARLMAGYVTINQLAAPPLGAALFAVGMAWPFAVELLCVLLGAVVLAGLRLPGHGTRPDERTHLRRDIAEGIRWLWRHDAVRTLALVIVLFNITWGAGWAVLVLYATVHLDMGEIGFGLLTTAGALGGLLGTASYGWLERRIPLGVLMKACLLLECVVHVAFALNRWPWVAMLIMFVFGGYAFVWGTLSSAVRQRAVPTEFQGRVSSVYLVGVFGGLVVGSLLGGWIARQWGITAPFWFAAAGSVLILAFLWRSLDLIVHADEQALAQAAE